MKPKINPEVQAEYDAHHNDTRIELLDALRRSKDGGHQRRANAVGSGQLFRMEISIIDGNTQFACQSHQIVEFAGPGPREIGLGFKGRDAILRGLSLILRFGCDVDYGWRVHRWGGGSPSKSSVGINSNLVG